MDILIVSYYFYPEIVPRAFRTFELAKELSRQGHKVTLIIPEYDFDYSEITEQYSFTIHSIKSGFFINKNAKQRSAPLPAGELRKSIRTRKMLLPLKWLYKQIYIEGNSFEYLFFLTKKLLGIREKFDLLISIGLPINVHIACSLGIMFKKNLCKIAIADYGDPFSGNSENSHPAFHSYIEKNILKKFDFITVPIEASKKLFFPLKDADHIKIIPQGFNLNQYKIASYIRNEVVSFAYAGVFYKKIRNPQFFFEYLLTLNFPFSFTLFTDTLSEDNMDLITPYIDKLGEKLIIRNLIPQVECIYALSTFDFLINFVNTSRNHSPSKLIDYSLTKRPVYFAEEAAFNTAILNEFLHFNFENDFMKNFDNSIYDIRKIAKAFMELSSDD